MFLICYKVMGKAYPSNSHHPAFISSNAKGGHSRLSSKVMSTLHRQPATETTATGTVTTETATTETVTTGAATGMATEKMHTVTRGSSTLHTVIREDNQVALPS